MAVATASTAVNMTNWPFYETIDVTFTPTQITEFLEGNRTTSYIGVGFSGSVEEGILGGELRQIYHYLDGVEQYRVTGLAARDAGVVYDYLEEDDQRILSYLFAGNDTFNGSNFADALNGYKGSDKLNGRGGNDVVNGGAGNDTIIWGAGDIVNGAAGTDKLKLSIDLDLTALPNTRIKNIETINMTGGGVEGDDLTLSITDVLALSSSTNTLKILGDANDRISIDTPELGTPTVQGSFDRYEYVTANGTAIVLIESDINNVF